MKKTLLKILSYSDLAASQAYRPATCSSYVDLGSKQSRNEWLCGDWNGGCEKIVRMRDAELEVGAESVGRERDLGNVVLHKASGRKECFAHAETTRTSPEPALRMRNVEGNDLMP